VSGAANLKVADLSDAVQDYLREIYKLQTENEHVRTSTLARRMGVAPPSATAMMKRLASDGLVEHQLYRGVRLTRSGERVALELLRHHRLLELYLARTLELGLDAVHAEADRLEHALSETLEDLIDKALGSPTQDPHGDPIPDSKLRIVHSKSRPLTELAPGEEATVQRVPDSDGELLRYLTGLALVPGRRVQLIRAEPFGGPLTLRTDRGGAVISRQLGDQIHVSISGENATRKSSVSSVDGSI
jgi:DtxR family transcriptional regulator, Mn-dependent transcriptional regulator